MDGSPGLLVPILETVLEGCLWEQFVKFPPDTVERLLPRLTLPRNIKRLAEIWVEEKQRASVEKKQRAAARAQRVARSRARRHHHV